MVPPKMLFAVFGPDWTTFDYTPLGRRDAARDLNGLVPILGFDEEVAAELLFGLGERAVGGGDLAVADAHGRGLVGVLQPVRPHVIAGLLDAFRECPIVLLRLLDLVPRDVRFLLFFLVNQAQEFHRSSERARNMPASPNSRSTFGEFDKTLTFSRATLCGFSPGRHADQLQDAGVAGGVRGGWVH